MQIPSPNLDFWNSYPKIYFWANLGRKSQSCSFFLKIGTHGIFKMLIFIPTLVFWISNLKSILGKIWTKKVKSFVLPENWYTCYLKVADSCSNISFLNFKTLIHFWANLDQKTQSCPVWLKIGKQSVTTMLILISALFLLFSDSNPKSFFGQIWAEKPKAAYFDWKLAHLVIEDADCYSDKIFLNCQS